MRKKFKVSYELVMVLILVAMCLLFGVLTDGLFLKPKTMIGCTSDVAYLGVQAMSMTLIILTAGIDLSVSYQMVCSAMVCATVYNMSGSALVAIIACIASGFVFGAMNGIIAAKTPINPWLITMSTMYIFQAISWFFGSSYAFSAGNPIVDVLNMKIGGVVPTQLIVLLVVYAVFWVLEKKTTFGRYTHAIGHNENAVNFSGINANRMKFWIYTLGGLTSAIAALMYMGRSWQVNQETGFNMNIEVIALVVLGGTSTAGGVGGVTGSLIACLIIGVLKKGLALMGLPGTVYNFIVGLVLIGSLIFFAYLQKRKKMVSRKMAIENMDEQKVA
ncbi:MAG: ABC transporter permease [Clostridiales bacterium]|nr:ABC transporter permease [Clostridiales bacterium]MCD8352941.1 ABC transporter permease [Clostridiales bacterium]